MPELRWTLLILGVIFIAVLTWWERRRPHQASRQTPHIGPTETVRTAGNTEPGWVGATGTEAARTGAGRTEPGWSTSDVADESARPPGAVRVDPSWSESSLKDAVPRELPVVEIPADSPLMGPPAGEDESFMEPLAAEPMPDPVEQEFADERVEADEDLEMDEDFEADEPVEVRGPIGAAAPDPTPRDQQREPPEPPIEISPRPADAAAPIVEWPPEDQRKLVSLRLVARPPERFQGRLVRQALSAEGFAIGPLDIFHKTDAQNRAVLSAAGLNKPGTFDLDTMDTQRFTGLNLFVVLPGPGDRTALRAFEDLLLTARTLNERLEGALQDERGGPLTPTRIQLIRDGLVSEARP